MPKVSVITPNYNCGRFIGQAIESVQAQTFADWELIICDDGSEDDSRDIITRYAKQDPRIVPTFNATRQGATFSRNNALKQAKGRYIAFLDSDDFWHPQKLDRQLRFMADTLAPMSHTWYDIVNENGDQIGVCRKRKAIITYHDLLAYHRVDCLTLICDRSQTGDFEFTASPQEDYALALMLMRRGLSSHCLKESLGSYRIRRRSRSSQKIKNICDVWHILGAENLHPLSQLMFFTLYLSNKTGMHVVRTIRHWLKK